MRWRNCILLVRRILRLSVAASACVDSCGLLSSISRTCSGTCSKREADPNINNVDAPSLRPPTVGAPTYLQSDLQNDTSSKLSREKTRCRSQQITLHVKVQRIDSPPQHTNGNHANRHADTPPHTSQNQSKWRHILLSINRCRFASPCVPLSFCVVVCLVRASCLINARPLVLFRGRTTFPRLFVLPFLRP